MEFKYVLYKKQELEHNGEMPAQICHLLGRVRRHGLIVEAVEQTSIPEYLRIHKIQPESTLVIAAKDETIKEISEMPIATIGYLHPDFFEEELYEADILVEEFEEVDFYFLERIYQRKHGIPWRIIETERCYLREMTVEDLDALYEMYEAPTMTEYMEPLYEREAEEEYTRAYISTMYRFYGYGMWVVMDRITDELIGRVGLNNLELDGENYLEMGYAIKVACQRKGYALETCKAVIAYAKEAGLGYEKLHCFVRQGNRASIGLLNRLGFIQTDNKWRDGRNMLVYELEL